MSEEIAIQIHGLKKQYRLGQIGGGTLTADLQSWWAKVLKKEDPNSKIGSEQRLIGQTFMALNGIDLTIKKGEALGIIGGNGAGKSTLLKILSRITAPTEGTVDIYGRITSMLEVGTGFSPEMTGRENIYMNGAILGMTRAEIDAKIEDIIDFSEVREFIDTPVKRYSSGMYVKLAFSVAAHLDSEIMIMDEVLAVGDMAFQKKCLDKMHDVAKVDGRTVLYVSHNMNTIRQLCDRCVVLDKGKVVFDGDVEEAVSMYLNTNKSSKLHYTYDKANHKCYKSVTDFVIMSLDILNKDSVFYKPGDIVDAILTCKSSRKYTNLKCRFEWQYQDGENVGTMISKQEVDSVCGIIRFKIQLDLTHMMPGRYSADIIIFTQNEYGTEMFIDGVYPGLTLEIKERINDDNYILWYHGPWGHLRLHDIKMYQQDVGREKI